MTTDLFYDERLLGRTIYRRLVDIVWPAVEEMTPRKLGETVSCGRGRAANCYGVRFSGRANARARGTTLAQTHASSQFWLGADWDGESFLLVIAASAIIAEICDQLEIDADRFMAEAARPRQAGLN